MKKKNYLKRTILKETIDSQHLEEERPIRIYLPPGYKQTISYPIIYAQDGQDIFMYGRIATIANYLILEKNMRPAIIVGVDVSKKKRTAEYASEGDRNKDYKRFFVEELLPFVESEYEVSKSGLQRLLIGDSLGATVSLDLALDHPELFEHVISLSGAFFESMFERVKATSDLSWLHLWMLIGTEEKDVKTHLGRLDFLSWNQKLKEVLEEKQAQVSYLEREGSHIWGFWQKELPNALLYFLK